MRPASIVQFERLFFASLAVRVVNDAVAYSATMKAIAGSAETAVYGPGVVIGMSVAIYALAIALWYFAAKRPSVVAKWLLSAWFVIAFCMMALGLYAGGFGLNLITLLSWAAFLLFGWSVSYLFKPDADAWFAKALSA